MHSRSFIPVLFPSCITSIICSTLMPITGTYQKTTLGAAMINQERISPDPAIEGYWTGQYLVDGLDQEPLSYSFFLFKDGTIFTRSLGGDGQTYFSEGTWRLTRDIFSAEIAWVADENNKKVKQKITSVFRNGCFLDATWRDVENPFPGSRMNKGIFIKLSKPSDSNSDQDLITLTRIPFNQSSLVHW